MACVLTVIRKKVKSSLSHMGRADLCLLSVSLSETTNNASCGVPVYVPYCLVTGEYGCEQLSQSLCSRTTQRIELAIS